MRLIYFSHSYRKEDASIVQYFGEMIRTENLIPVLDPPSETVNAARLQRHLRDSDGMVVVLTRRDAGVSPHILFEATMCLQARKPLLVFVEDVLPPNAIPHRVLHSRFSRKWYFRQVRDHRHAMRMFQTYLGENPPPRYQPSHAKQKCLAVGMSVLRPKVRDAVAEAVEAYGYDLVNDSLSERLQDESIRLSEHLACADLAVEVVDSPELQDHYFMGAIRATFIPRISLTCNKDYEWDSRIPREYQPRTISLQHPAAASAVIRAEFDLYEQAFLELDAPNEVRRYVQLLLAAGDSNGQYEQATRNLFIKEMHVGDEYKVKQAVSVGSHAHVHDNSIQQAWNESSSKIDLNVLSDELNRLRAALKAEAKSAEEDAAVGQISAGELAAKQGDGPRALAHLKNAGKWALSVAEKIGVAVAAGAIKTAMGL
jgi:hypothetical protein